MEDLPLMTSAHFTPIYQQASFGSFPLFIPYYLFPQGYGTYKCVIGVSDDEFNLITSVDTVEFDVDRS